MPRWNRREKPDYRRLRDVMDDAALVNAIRSPTYGEAYDYRLLAGFQARLVAMWGDRDLLALDELVPAHEGVRARDPGFFGHGRNWQGAFLHDAVGNLVGWGLRLGVLREEPPYGRQVFAMVRRDPLFERVGNGRWRRLDADGVRAKSTRGAGQREAARVRHAEEITPVVREYVGRLCAAEAEIHPVWLSRFPDQFARLHGLATLVSDARTTFEEAHRGMHLADQKAWVKILPIYTRDWEMRRRREALDHAVVPSDDVEALGGLV
ncbi:hypothetical protein [uncultured Methylobacterium sp.]|jgi:hypothetical protein|uniref:hypothetical protein n=1 Tax=uncultured Methylobacterium sp. TaxID=157278 RepID=UPI002612D0BE|nr:hypothetical protein [uncultured Methylobacterium sp.]